MRWQSAIRRRCGLLMNLGRRQLQRYSRHLLIPEVALGGQQRLSEARVLVIGAGGLGAPVLQYLAAAGIGRIGIMDGDVVDVTNLQRQVLFNEADVNQPKALVAAQRLRILNPLIAVDPIAHFINAANARDIIRLYDLVIDATDNFEARYLINDASRLENVPDVYGAIYRFEGQVATFAPDGPCYRCLFPSPPPPESIPSCSEGGVLGSLAGVVGALQATEALKLLLGIGRSLIGRMVLIDSLAGDTQHVNITIDRDCELHGAHQTIVDVNSVAVQEPRVNDSKTISAAMLDAYLDKTPSTRLLDVREEHEVSIGVAPRAVHIPASQIEGRLHELDSAIEYVVACRIGTKSRFVTARLKEIGFQRLLHLEGGLNSYALSQQEFLMF